MMDSMVKIYVPFLHVKQNGSEEEQKTETQPASAAAAASRAYWQRRARADGNNQ